MAVDAGVLLKELDAHWRHKGEGPDVGVGAAGVRDDADRRGARGEDAQALGVTLADIMHEHPNRTIVPGDDGEVTAPGELAVLDAVYGRQQICCEQIEITSSLATLGQCRLCSVDGGGLWWRCGARSTVRNLPVRPVLSWLAGDGGWFNSAGMRVALPALQALSTGSWRLADLAWTRATRWRETVAHLACVEGWTWAEEVEITWAGEGVPPAAAYVAAWLGPERLVMRCDTVEMPAAGAGRIKRLTVRAQGRQACLRREGTGGAAESEGLRTGMSLSLPCPAGLLHGELGVFGLMRGMKRLCGGFRRCWMHV